MRKWILVALALMAWAGTAAAQTVVRDGQSVRVDTTGAAHGGPATITPMMPMWVGGYSASDSVSHALRFDTSGNLMIAEQSPATSWYFYQPSIINNDLVIGNRDSSAVWNVTGANHLYLHIAAAPDTSISCGTLWAIQIRRHLDASTDSSSTWIALDMNGNGVNTANNNGTTGSANDMIATAGTDTIGTLNYALTNKPASTALWPGERLLAIPVIAVGPRKLFSLELTNQNGAPMTGRLISFRVRLLAVYTSTACTSTLDATNGRANIRFDLAGTR